MQYKLIILQYKWNIFNTNGNYTIEYLKTLYGTNEKKYTIEMKLYNANVNNRMQMKNDIMQYYNANQTL